MSYCGDCGEEMLRIESAVGAEYCDDCGKTNGVICAARMKLLIQRAATVFAEANENCSVCAGRGKYVVGDPADGLTYECSVCHPMTEWLQLYANETTNLGLNQQRWVDLGAKPKAEPT